MFWLLLKKIEKTLEERRKIQFKEHPAANINKNDMFFRKPTRHYQFKFGDDFQWALSEDGNVVGKIIPSDKGIHIQIYHRDMHYYALNKSINFDEKTITAMANKKDWHKIQENY